jgi:hypothetical protein
LFEFERGRIETLWALIEKKGDNAGAAVAVFSHGESNNGNAIGIFPGLLRFLFDVLFELLGIIVLGKTLPLAWLSPMPKVLNSRCGTSINDIGILLDGARFLQVREHRDPAIVLLDVTVQLSQSDDRHLQLNGPAPSNSGDLRLTSLARES